MDGEKTIGYRTISSDGSEVTHYTDGTFSYKAPQPPMDAPGYGTLLGIAVGIAAGLQDAESYFVSAGYGSRGQAAAQQCDQAYQDLLDNPFGVVVHDEVQIGYCQVEEPKESEDELLDRLLAARGWVAMPREEADRLNEMEAGFQHTAALEAGSATLIPDGETSHPSTPRGLSVLAEPPLGLRMGTKAHEDS